MAKPIEINSTKPKHPGGRPTSYRKEFADKLIKFFDIPFSKQEVSSVTRKKDGAERIEYKEVGIEMPFLGRFAWNIGICEETLSKWGADVKNKPEFVKAYKRAKAIQKEILISNSTRGLYNPTAFIFTAKNITDMRDKTEIEHTGNVLTDLLTQISHAKQPLVK